MKNILLYLSAFIPMYALIIVKQCIELLVGNLKVNFLNLFVMGLLTVIILLGLLGLKLENFNKKAETTKVYVLKKTNTTDQHFLGYFSLFVLFAITFDLSKVSMLVVFILILVMIGIVYVKNKLFYINPFLNIFGYNFYDITFREFGSKEEKTIKIFFKGDLVLGEQYTLTTKDENFSFLKEKKNSNK